LTVDDVTVQFWLQVQTLKLSIRTTLN